MFVPPPIFNIQDVALAAQLQSSIDGKTKPRGSLGTLEALALQMGLVQRTLHPSVNAPAIAVFAADHGVAHEGVSAYPQSVTWQMVENFLAGGAAINVFARRNGIRLHIVDAGVNHEFGSRAGLISRKQGPGTRNFVQEAAMTPRQCADALRAGVALVESWQQGAGAGMPPCVGHTSAQDAAGVETPPNVLGFGEMGIGNTTAAAAIMLRLADVPLARCVGAGTGVNADGMRRKQAVIEAAMRRHRQAREPLEVLAAFGGFEIAMMVGAMLQAAAARMLLLIDGFIVTSALLVAARLCPAILDYCVFCHRSDESGHARMLDALGGRPLLDLGLRLGEGTGCALALPLLRSAADFLAEMATFDSAGVSDCQA